MLLFTLIIWSSLCTAIDPSCETGDYVVHGQYKTLVECNAHLRAWKIARIPTNRGVCYRRKRAT
jgi:hypothetical protein